MASRRRAREFALQALYQADIRETTVPAALNDLWSAMMDGEGIEDSRPPESEEVEFAQRLAVGVDERRAEIDGLVEESSTNWRLPRMPVVDRNVLRLATFELPGHPGHRVDQRGRRARQALRDGGQPGLRERDRRSARPPARAHRRAAVTVRLQPLDGFWLLLPIVVTAAALTMSATPEQVSWFGFDVPVLCMFRRLTGISCPGCGLTRSFVLLVHGQWADALRTNPLGPFVFAAMVLQAPALLVYRIRASGGAGARSS
jgi:Protein of unknown function (DUF2752)/NusB family